MDFLLVTGGDEGQSCGKADHSECGTSVGTGVAALSLGVGLSKCNAIKSLLLGVVLVDYILEGSGDVSFGDIRLGCVRLGGVRFKWNGIKYTSSLVPVFILVNIFLLLGSSVSSFFSLGRVDRHMT